MMVALQWMGFAGVVAGAFFYVSRPTAGAVLTAMGCVFLGVWSLCLDPAAYGTCAAQAAVFVLSIRNLIKLGATNGREVQPRPADR